MTSGSTYLLMLPSMFTGNPLQVGLNLALSLMWLMVQSTMDILIESSCYLPFTETHL